MASSIIGDAKFQELNMSFTFDQQHQGKLIIEALVQNLSYQIELAANPYLDFEDLKNALITKQFKLISKSPQSLKLKIGATNLQFQNVEKITINSLKQTVAELTNNFKYQCQKNAMLEDTIKKIQTQLDLMTTKMADMEIKNDSLKDLLEKKIEKNEKQMNSLREQLAKSRIKIYSYQEKLGSQDMKQELIQYKVVVTPEMADTYTSIQWEKLSKLLYDTDKMMEKEQFRRVIFESEFTESLSLKQRDIFIRANRID